MVEPLSVNTNGVRSLGDVHTRVAGGLGALAAGTPGAAEVGASHGTIAYGVDTALTAALGSRSGSMNTTRVSGTQISELLH
ncbi:MAG: type VII secretion target, partial [Mycobacterium sp.]|nr:type VII secretion target [Mycobacterium sp.]